MPKLVLSTQRSKRFSKSIYAALEELEEGNNGKEEEGREGDKEDHADGIGKRGLGEDCNRFLPSKPPKR